MNAGRHHQQIDDEAEHPHQLARRLVRTVIKSAEDVDVGDDEEEAGAVHVRVAQQPAGVDVAHDQLVDRIECAVGGRGIMHRQHDAGDDLDGQEDPGEDSEIPEIIEVARHRIAAADRAIDEPRKRQALVDPAHQRMLGFVGLGPGKAHCLLAPEPIAPSVGDVNLYSGTCRFFGAGPCRMRAAVSYIEPWHGQK